MDAGDPEGSSILAPIKAPSNGGGPLLFFHYIYHQGWHFKTLFIIIHHSIALPPRHSFFSHSA